MRKTHLLKLTANFWLHEFNCNDGTPVPQEYMSNVRELAENLQVLRDDLGVPVYLISAYRTPTYNKKVKGKKFSKHLKAQAGDIMTKEFTPAQVQARIEKLITAGKMKQGGLGKYRTFTHYDVRGTRARW